MFSRFFIDRPIFATVLSLAISIAGGLALLNLPVSQYPEISPPAVTVSISYPGASAEVVADTVAAPIEQQVNGVPGMLYLSSNSGNDGSYSLTVTFEIGTDLNAALVMVQNRVQLALPVLPTAVQLQGITVRKRTPDILLVISFTSPGEIYDSLYLSNYATVNVRDALLRTDGVSDVTLFGQRDYSMRVWLDPQKLAARNLTALDVAAAVRSQNNEAAVGRVGQPPGGHNRSFQFPLSTLGRLSVPEQFSDVVIKATPPRLPEKSSGGGSGNSMRGSAPNGMGTTTGAGSGSGGTTNSGAGPADLLASILAPLTDREASTSTGAGPASTPATNSLAIGPASAGRTNSGGGAATGTASALAATSATGTVGPNSLSGGTLDGGPDAAGSIVRIRDVARVELGAATYDSGASFDGKPSVGLAVRLLPGSNALATGDLVRARMAEMKKQFPLGIDYEIAYDTTPFIRESISDVVWTLFEAVGLVALVVLLFLRSWRATIIPMAAVPVAILGTFAVMLSLGFTINNISLFGLVLAIGIVVDDAIVVVENVERWLERGLEPREAAYRAMEEVTGPVVAIAVVLCAVFVPCAFVGGIPGQFYRQFAVTITASTVLSAINSLTLSPALAAILLRKPNDGTSEKPQRSRTARTLLLPIVVAVTAISWVGNAFEVAFARGTSAYAWIVKWLVRLGLIVVVLYLGLLFLTYRTFARAPIGFVPEQDQGRLIVSVQLPDSASLNRTQAVLAQVEQIALKTAGVAHTTSTGGMSLVAGANSSNFGSVFLVLDPFEKRQHPSLRAPAIMAKLRREYAKISEADVKIFGAPSVPGLGVAGGFKVVVEDRGGLGLGELQKQTDALVAKLQKEPATVGVLTQFRSKTPQLYLDVDRTKVEALGVDLNAVNQTMQIYLGSLYANSFSAFGRHWQVKLQAEGEFRNRVGDVGLLQVRNNRGEMVPLSTLVTLKEVKGPVSVNRYNLYPAAAISGNAAPDASSGEAIAAVNRIAAETLPRAMTTEWTELFYLQIRTGNTAIYVFGLAVVFVFLALAALYESWAMPLAVILVVPLCLLCSVGGVLLSGKSVDIFVQIGLIVLVGLACKNAILIVEFAEVLRGRGTPRREAAVEASRLRIRPILMTSLAFVLGVVPLVIASGAGAEMRRSLGTAVFSGMLGVTAFGIFLTPVFFDLVRCAIESRLVSQPLVRRVLPAMGGALIGAFAGASLARLGWAAPQNGPAVGGAVGATVAVATPWMWNLIGPATWRLREARR